MVGSRFCELSTLPLVKADLNGEISVDITRPQSVADFFESHDFETVILFSAFTDVDAAEKQRGDKNGLCWRINVIGVNNLVKACKKYDRKIIFISTDFVFDGKNGPYSESDPPGEDLEEVSWYGISKLEAEKIIQKTLKNYIILRIAYPYRANFTKKDDIARRILKLYSSGNLYPMFYDQKITPTFIDDIPKAINLLISTDQIGIFHLASPERTTQYDFAKFLINLFKGDTVGLRKTSIKKFLKDPNSTPRPVIGGLKVNKIKKLGFNPTLWKIGLKTIYIQSRSK